MKCIPNLTIWSHNATHTLDIISSLIANSGRAGLFVCVFTTVGDMFGSIVVLYVLFNVFICICSLLL